MKQLVTKLTLAAAALTLATCGHKPTAAVLAGGPNATHTPLPAGALNPTVTLRIKNTGHGPVAALPDSADAEQLCAATGTDRVKQIRAFSIPDGGTIRMDEGLRVRAQHVPHDADIPNVPGVTVFAVIAPNGLAGYVCNSDVETAT